MKITPQICPQCSGPLRIAADRQTGICDYCKTTVVLQTDINSDRMNSLIQSGMDYLREGDFNSAEQQGKNIIAIDSTRGEGWLLKTATNFDIAQANQSFENGLRKIDDASRQEFALIFKQLALYVWKQANKMLVRDVEKRGMSRAAKQHYEIKAKAAQLSAFAIELFPLAGWADEVAKYTPIKSWEEHSQAEKIERFDILTAFDSKSASDLTAFIACRERFMEGLSEYLPDEYATLVQRAESVSVSAVKRQPKQEASKAGAGYIKLAIALPLWLALDYAFMDGDYSSTGFIMGSVTATVCVAGSGF